MHETPPLELQVGDHTKLTVILVHGRGGRAEEMKALAGYLGVDGVCYLCPAASGQVWYPQSFMAPVADNEPHLSAAIARIEEIVKGVLDGGTPAGSIVVGGFSQGACLAGEYVARHPRRYGGVIMWTGGLIGPPGTTWPVDGALQGMPVYLTTGETDPWVPPERVRETEGWFRDCGADVTARVFADRDHMVSEEEIEAGRRLLRGVMEGA